MTSSSLSVSSIGSSNDGIREVTILDANNKKHTLEVGSTGSLHRKLKEAEKNGTKVNITANSNGPITAVEIS